jgi:hypothetical protein
MKELPIVVVYTDNSVKVEYIDLSLLRFGYGTIRSVCGWFKAKYISSACAAVIMHGDFPYPFETAMDEVIRYSAAVGYNGFEGEIIDKSMECFLMEEDTKSCFDPLFVKMNYLNLGVVDEKHS